MINLITGRPGGGKSYEAVVKHVIPAIKEGRKIITNLPLNLKHIEKVFGKECLDLIVIIQTDLHDYGNSNRPFSEVDHYKDDWRNDNGQGALVIVDECHMVIPNRGCGVPLLEFLSMHRHFGIDIIFITQSNKKIHRDVKDMVELEYRCIKATALGSNDKYIKKVHMGCSGSVVNEEIRAYDKSMFPFYQSHTASNGAVKEALAKDIKPFYKHGLFYFFIILVFMFFFGIYKVMSNDKSLLRVDSPDIVVVSSVVDGVPLLETSLESEIKKKALSHPLESFVIVVRGYVQNVRFKDNKISTYDGSIWKVFIDINSGSDLMMKTDSNALTKMGYVVKELSECIYQISFDGSIVGVFPCVVKDDKKQTVDGVISSMNPLA